MSAPAVAAGGTLNLTVDAVSSTVKSGEGASFRVQWTCSGAGSCDDAKIEVPLPSGMPGSAAFPSGVPLTVTSQSLVQIGGSTVPGSATIVGTAPDRKLVWTFPSAVATGNSGTVSFTLLAPNSVTPDGTTITPVATFSATGATPVTANANGAVKTTVTSAISLTTVKSKVAPTDVPYVDQQVTYAILVGYDEQIPTGINPSTYAKNMKDVCETVGVQALQNLKVVDTLPAGAEFVSATNSGAYDAATNTVTWTLGSSINDTAPYACKPFSGATSWTGDALRVTVKYPSPEFGANPSPTAVTNDVVATANAWGQPAVELSSNDSASHALRVGSSGASVSKSPGYDWSVGQPLYRQVPSSNNYVYYLTGTSLDANPARWRFVDVMPCALTSPTDANDTDCATPGLVNLTFAADQFLPELSLAYTTNTGATGVCTIPAGNSMSDTTRRFCAGTSGTSPIALPAGQWITKIELDTEIPAFGGGRVYIYGTPSTFVPTDNVDTVYNNPSLDVDRSDVHPWYVTMENCPISNAVTLQSGQVYQATPNPQVAADNGGICGYRQIMTDPFRLRPTKAMYDPTLPGTPPAVPAVQTGETLQVDLSILRTVQGADSSAVIAGSTFTPTVTEYLPANLELVPGSLQIVRKNAADQAFVDELGAPDVAVENVTVFGEPRQKITITFPDENVQPGTAHSMGREALARFTVKVKDGTAAGTYQNHYLLTGEEGGAGVDTTYLTCSTGTMVDANLTPTSDRSVAVGCLAQSSYTVLPVPGVGTSKTVQGAYDDDAIVAPGVGTTGIDGDAEYVVDVVNSGSVDLRNVVAYDLFPRVGDTMTLPGASGTPRNSTFPVRLTGAVDAPAGATVQYTTSTNPCRGDLAGTGGAAIGSAPSGCDNDWATTPPGGDYGAATGIRVDFGSQVFAAGDREQLTLTMRAHGTDTPGAQLNGLAWNNVAVVAAERTSGTSTLPTEQTPVGLRMLPDVTWSKVDAETSARLAGSEWELQVDGQPRPGFPLSVIDCTATPCTGADQDPATGGFRLSAVEWGQYKLVEVTAPDGYQPLVDPIAVDLAPANLDGDSLALELGAIENREIPGEWTLSKTSDPASGSVVAPGSTVTYTLTAVNSSQRPVDDVVVTDDLGAVLNHASFVGFVESDGGKATRTGSTLTWNVGRLAAGETRTVTYAVKVNADARGISIRNVVTGNGEVPPTDCAPGDPCETTHDTPGVWSLSKTSDPASGSVVAPGSTVTYTLTAVNASAKPVADVVVTDDLGAVLNHASFAGFTQDDGGKATRSGDTITWNVGRLAAGETRTVTYAVKLNADARGISIRNVVTGTGEVPPEECAPDEPCDTTHDTPGVWSLSKTSDPASGSVVAPGSTVTYTLTAVNDSAKPVNDIVVTDDLGAVLKHASFAGFTEDDGGKATRSGTTITWNVGKLAAGETRTVTYAVKLNADADGITIRNVVTGDGEVPPEDCGPTEPCDTTHETPEEPPTSETPEKPEPPTHTPTTALPDTGAGPVAPLVTTALLLLLAGLGAIAWGRRGVARHRA